MLGFTATESGFARARSVSPVGEAVQSTERRLAVVPSNRDVRASQDQRRAVGTISLVSAVLVDMGLLFLWLNVIFELTGRASRFFGLVYVATAMVMLAPTYRRGRIVPRPSEVLARVTAAVALAPMITAILTLASNSQILTTLYTRSYIVLVAVTVASIMIARAVMFQLTNVVRARGYDLEDTIIVGAGPVGVEVAQALQDNPGFGLTPFGFVDRFDERLPYPIVGQPEDLLSILETSQVRHVVLAFGAASESELVTIVRRCSVLPVQFYAVPRFFELGVSSANVGHELDGFALVPMRRPGHGHSMSPAKRAFDLAVSAFLLLVTLPVMAACALAVKLSSPGPVFFRQVRIGVNGRPFEILKFRSMRVNDDHSTTWSVDDDHRVTRIGHFLRRSHLDELPQLINVLRGEMSIVGPRPERPYFVEQFTSEIDGYADRHRMPVGITGWAQVNGFWGDTSIEARVRLDNRYIENWSLWRDLMIALRTIPTLLGGRR